MGAVHGASGLAGAAVRIAGMKFNLLSILILVLVSLLLISAVAFWSLPPTSVIVDKTPRRVQRQDWPPVVAKQEPPPEQALESVSGQVIQKARRPNGCRIT